MANPNAYATATFGTITFGVWSAGVGNNANPSAAFPPAQWVPWGGVFVTNAKTVAFPTVTLTAFAGTAVGVTLTNGFVRSNVTPNGYANVMDGGMPGPVTNFTPSMKDLMLGNPTLIISSES